MAKQLTFKGYLRAKLVELANTTYVKDCLNLVDTKPEIKPVLVLYSILTGKSRLGTSTKYNYIAEEYNYFVSQFDSDDLLDYEIMLNEREIPEDYRKLYSDYKRIINLSKVDNVFKRLAIEPIKKMLGECQVSIGDMCRTLQLNSSNIGGYLNHGRLCAVSHETIEKMYMYLAALPTVKASEL